MLVGGGVSCWGGREGGRPNAIKGSQDVSGVAVGMDTLLVHRDGKVSALRQGGQVRKLAKASDVAQAATQFMLSCLRFTRGTVSCYRSGVFKDSTPTAEERAPEPLPGVKDAVDIGVGIHFVCAVRAKGGVVCAHAGPESKGKPRAAPVPGVSNAKRVQVATSVACAQLADDRVRCFSLGRKSRWSKEFEAADTFAVHQGDPYDSPLLCLSRGSSVGCQRLESIGGGHALPTLPPGNTQLPGIKTLTQLRAVNHAVCGLDTEGALHCFGHNINAVLGHPDTRYLDRAMPVSGVPKARDVGVGQRFACALTQSGEVWCWGLAATAKKSTAQEPVRSKPKRVAGLSGMKRMIVHNAYGCAFDPADNAHCFFGTESSSRSRAPYRVAALDGVQSALLPEMGVLGQAVAIDRKGQLLLGANPGFDDLKQLTLAPVPGLARARRVTGSYSRLLVQLADGKVHQLQARQGKLTSPIKHFAPFDSAVDMLGYRFALFQDGEVRTVGSNEKGARKIVQGSPLTRFVPGPGICGVTAKGSVRCVATSTFASPEKTLFRSVVRVAGTEDTQCAIDASGRVLCRGACSTGECGVTQGVHYSKSPLRVPLPAATGKGSMGASN